jgi:chromosome segregation ATPase
MPPGVNNSSWKWVGFVGALALVVIGLNTGLFIIVQQNEREISNRELAALRLSESAKAMEDQRSKLTSEIADLVIKRAEAVRRTDEAERAATEATRKQSEFNRLAQELQTVTTELAKRKVDSAALNERITKLSLEEASVGKKTSDRAAEIASHELRRDGLLLTIKTLEEQRIAASRDADAAQKAALDASKQKAERDNVNRELQEKVTELARLRPEVEALKASRNITIVDESAAKRADAARAEAEKLRDSAQDEMRTVQMQLLQARSALARVEHAERALSLDEGAAQRANASRIDSEKILAKLREEQSAAESRLSSTRAEVAQLEQRRAALTIDDAVAKRAQATRLEAESALSKAQGDLFVVQKRIADLQNEVAQLEATRNKISVDEAAAKRADALRVDAEKRLGDAKLQLEDINREIIEGTERRNPVDPARSAPISPSDTAPSSMPQPAPARRADPAFAIPAPRGPLPPRPAPRPVAAPRTLTQP